MKIMQDGARSPYRNMSNVHWAVIGASDIAFETDGDCGMYIASSPGSSPAFGHAG